MLYKADDDPELRDWIEYQFHHGSAFLHSYAQLAKMADITEYQFVRPSLLNLRARSPEPESTIVKITTDSYQVTFDDREPTDGIVGKFNRFNAAVFGGTLPQTTIRWASSISSHREPGLPIGLLALPDDPVSHPMPTQRRLQVPHIFITQKLREVSPVEDFVLLHEMCHFKVRNHGPDFINELHRALDCIQWKVLLGGY